MIKRLFILIVSMLCAVHPADAQQGYTVETVPNVQLADARRFVSNPDGILSEVTVEEIDRLCLDLRQKQLAEVVVLVLERVYENSLDMFAHNVLNRWGVGQRGKDNGLVISVVRGQRDIQFATGYGLEGVLPDALCKRIQTVYMVEPLRAGNYDKGVLNGVKAVYNVLTDNRAELTALSAADSGDAVGLGMIGAATLPFIVFVALIIVIAARRRRKNRDNDFNDGPDSPSGGGGFSGPNTGSIIGGILGGLLGGGGFGGGGFSGGGFGGGRSGGGGARTGF